MTELKSSMTQATVRAELGIFNLIIIIYTFLLFVAGAVIALFYNSQDLFLIVFVILSTLWSIVGFIYLFLGKKQDECNVWGNDILVAKILSGINIAFGILISILGVWIQLQMARGESPAIGGMKTISLLAIMFTLMASLITSFTLSHRNDNEINITYWINMSISIMLITLVYISVREFYDININRTMLTLVGNPVNVA